MIKIKIPPRIDFGSRHSFTIGHLIHTKREHEKGDSGLVTAERYACGFPIPDFQRELVWTQDQEVKFIESIWLGLPIGTYCVHDSDWNNDGTAKPMSGWLIDGQQRLTTIERYLDDKLTVFGGLYSQVSRLDRSRFQMTVFPMTSVILFDEQKVEYLYNLMAFGGTPHTIEQHIAKRETK